MPRPARTTPLAPRPDAPRPAARTGRRPLVAGVGAAAALTTLLATALAGAVATPASARVVDDPVVRSADGARLAVSPLASYETGVFDESAAEIVAYHAATKRLFSVDAQAAEVTVLDVADATAPRRAFALRLTGVPAADGSVVPEGAVANSVAVRPDGLGVVAVESHDKTEPGWLVVFDAAGDGSALGAVRVGSLPDMVALTPDGRSAVVANEGEPADDFSVDPEGSVAVVALPATVTAPGQDAVRIADFHAWEAPAAGGTRALPDGVRVFGPDVADASGSLAHRVSRNLEPEYVAVSGDSATAWVTLQEANAFAVVDLASATVTDLLPLGSVDHSQAGHGIDPSDRDGVATIRTVPVRGLYMPDGVASYEAGGQTYLVTANEGDAREWGDYVEGARVKDLGKKGLAPLCADNPAVGRTADSDLGRLNVTTASGLSADGSCYEQLYSFGTRSFSVWTADGERVFDSAEDFERITADALGDAFNTNHTETKGDGRSDDKGPEPENVTLGEVDGRTYAFVGLERAGGVMVYDVTDPRDVSFVTYVNARDLGVSVEDAIDDGADPAATLSAAGDLGPEGLTFIPAAGSPTGTALLAVANEVSGTTTLFTVDPAPTKAPGVARLSDDNSHDGVRGGSYTVTADLWWGQNGTTFRLYEDGELVATRHLVDRSPAAQRVAVTLDGRANGTYRYTCELENAAGVTACPAHTVRVTDAAPATPRLSHDNHDGDGTYTVSADLWWGTNATSWVLTEDGVEVARGDLTAATPAAQHVDVPLSGRSKGTHRYVVTFVNDLGSTDSPALTVRVR